MTAERVDVDDDVALLGELIDQLRQLGAQEDVDEGRVYDFSIRWGAALAGRLRRLVHYQSLGALSDADERRFEQLRDDLAAVANLVERFDVARPGFDEAPIHRPRRR